MECKRSETATFGWLLFCPSFAPCAQCSLRLMKKNWNALAFQFLALALFPGSSRDFNCCLVFLTGSMKMEEVVSPRLNFFATYAATQSLPNSILLKRVAEFFDPVFTVRPHVISWQIAVTVPYAISKVCMESPFILLHNRRYNLGEGKFHATENGTLRTSAGTLDWELGKPPSKTSKTIGVGVLSRELDKLPKVAIKTCSLSLMEGTGVDNFISPMS